MEPWVAWTVAVVTTSLSTWQLWLLPSLLLRGVKLAQVPQVTDWLADPPPDDARAWLEAQAGALAGRGFVLGQQTCVRGEILPAVAWRTHLRHKKDRTRAALTAWYLDGEDEVRALRQELSLQVEAAGGRTLLLTTSDDVDASLWPNDLVAVVLAEEADLDVVLGAFSRKLEELGPDRARARRNQRRGPEEAAARRQELLDHQLELRLVRLDEGAAQWRLTWSGACMNAFYRFWPLRRRVVASQRREARRLSAP